jgi:DNA polymerase-3 subunit epsilon
MLREIILDTETTGLDAKGGDRIIELGCVEIVNRIPTGRELHRFINPEARDVHPDAERIHGISTAFLKDKPRFAEIVDDLLAFIGDAPVVIHNAGFDIGFLNAELDRAGRPPLTMDRVVDTLTLARRRHPAGPNSLDALCKRYGVDNTHRTKHGAIVDALLLATVYVELLGERQATLGLSHTAATADSSAPTRRANAARQRPKPLPPRLTAADTEAHRRFVGTLGPGALWHKYGVVPDEPAGKG